MLFMWRLRVARRPIVGVSNAVASASATRRIHGTVRVARTLQPKRYSVGRHASVSTGATSASVQRRRRKHGAVLAR